MRALCLTAAAAALTVVRVAAGVRLWVGGARLAAAAAGVTTAQGLLPHGRPQTGLGKAVGRPRSSWHGSNVQSNHTLSAHRSAGTQQVGRRMRVRSLGVGRHTGTAGCVRAGGCARNRVARNPTPGLGRHLVVGARHRHQGVEVGDGQSCELASKWDCCLGAGWI